MAPGLAAVHPLLELSRRRDAQAILCELRGKDEEKARGGLEQTLNLMLAIMLCCAVLCRSWCDCNMACHFCAVLSFDRRTTPPLPIYTHISPAQRLYVCPGVLATSQRFHTEPHAWSDLLGNRRTGGGGGGSGREHREWPVLERAIHGGHSRRCVNETSASCFVVVFVVLCALSLKLKTDLIVCGCLPAVGSACRKTMCGVTNCWCVFARCCLCRATSFVLPLCVRFCFLP